MKKFPTLAVAFLACISGVFAQPTLRQIKNSPVPGEGFYGHIVDSEGLSAVPVSGAAITWNFPTLTVTGMDTNYYYDCGSTAYCDSFPASNIVSLIDSNFEYGRSDSAMLAFMGWASSAGANHFQGKEVWLVYPFTYGSSHKDTFKMVESIPGVYYDSMIIFDSFVADGYGTLILPTGTFTNVLRLHHIFLEFDSTVYTGTDSGSIYGQSDAYQWFDTSGFHNPLFIITYDTSGGGGIPYVTNAEYYARAPFIALSEHTPPSVAVNHLTVYPNPASEVVNVTFDLTETGGTTVTLLDMVGRTLTIVSGEQLHTGTNRLTFSTSAMPPGMYVVQLQSSTGIATQKVVVEK